MDLDDEPPDFQSDPGIESQIAKASDEARMSFRYFWREVAWDRKRLVTGLNTACVKLPFSDPGEPDRVEHMWISEIDFDGRTIVGALANEPETLTGIKRGDSVSTSINQISDWLYGLDGKAYGGHTIQQIRSQMPEKKRLAHDRAWGLEFCDSFKAHLFPKCYARKKHLLDAFSRNHMDDEHPMSRAMKSQFAKLLKDFPEQINQADERGWTMLHKEALAGNRTGVNLLLKKGADVNIETPNGMTALALAESLGWQRVISQLNKAGA